MGDLLTQTTVNMGVGILGSIAGIGIVILIMIKKSISFSSKLILWILFLLGYLALNNFFVLLGIICGILLLYISILDKSYNNLDKIAFFIIFALGITRFLIQTDLYNVLSIIITSIMEYFSNLSLRR